MHRRTQKVDFDEVNYNAQLADIVEDSGPKIDLGEMDRDVQSLDLGMTCYMARDSDFCKVRCMVRNFDPSTFSW